MHRRFGRPLDADRQDGALRVPAASAGGLSLSRSGALGQRGASGGLRRRRARLLQARGLGARNGLRPGVPTVPPGRVNMALRYQLVFIFVLGTLGGARARANDFWNRWADG